MAGVSFVVFIFLLPESPVLSSCCLHLGSYNGVLDAVWKVNAAGGVDFALSTSDDSGWLGLGISNDAAMVRNAEHCLVHQYTEVVHSLILHELLC